MNKIKKLYFKCDCGQDIDLTLHIDLGLTFVCEICDRVWIIHPNGERDILGTLNREEK